MLIKDQIPALIRTSAKRYLQTIPVTPVSKISPSVFGSLPSSSATANSTHHNIQQTSSTNKTWSSHSLPTEGKSLLRAAKPFSKASKPFSRPIQPQTSAGVSTAAAAATTSANTQTQTQIQAQTPIPVAVPPTLTQTSTPAAAAAAAAAKPKRKLRPRKAAIKLSETAVQHLHALLDAPDPKLIRIGVRNRGCSGLTYHLEYVSEPGKFDEEILQDGVKVLIDSKALFSIIGSEMDWVDDKLASRFVFRNPNSKGECGCGESFMV